MVGQQHLMSVKRILKGHKNIILLEALGEKALSPSHISSFFSFFHVYSKFNFNIQLE